MSRQPSKESKQAWLQRNLHKRPTINKHCRLRRFYGIYPEDFAQMLVDQKGMCAICKLPFGDNKAALPHIDHDHSTKWVRGLLCHNCNSAIGLFREDIGAMQSAIEYLINTATPTEFVFTPGAIKEREHTKEWREAASKRQTGNKHREGKSPWNKGKKYKLPRRASDPLHPKEI